MTPAGFTGFGPGLRTFFHGLAENQHRDWFQAHRAQYDTEVRDPLARLVTSLTLAFVAYDVPLRGDPKTSMFRINRDTRFAKDKRPYKTNAGAVWTRDGTKHSQGLFYFQVGLDDPFAACGFYGPEPDQLHALRTAIVGRPDRWLGVEAALAVHDLALSPDHALTRLPRGFNADTVKDVAHAIRCTSLVVSRKLTEAEIGGPDLVDTLVSFASQALPLLTFGWTALAAVPARRT